MISQLVLLVAITGAIPDGSVIIKASDHGVVKTVTGSPICHTAMIFNHNGVPWVYDSYPPHVRAMPWEDYKYHVWKQMQHDPSLKMWLMWPKEKYSPREVYSMLRYAQSQLGRPYGVRSYVMTHPAKTIDCSEYTSWILVMSGRYGWFNPWNTSPADFYRGIAPHYYCEQIVFRK